MQSSRYTNASPEEQAIIRSAYFANLSQDALDYQVDAAIWRANDDQARLIRLRDDLARVGITHKAELVEVKLQNLIFFNAQRAQAPPPAAPAAPAAPVAPSATVQQLVDNGRADDFVAEIAGTHDLEEARYNANVAFNPATLGIRDVWESYIPPELREVDAWRN